MFRKLAIVLMLLMVPTIAMAQLTEVGKTPKTVTNADVVGLTYWCNDTIWTLEGFVYVEDGEKLVIEAGTIIKALPGAAGAASALIVSRGGQIYAQGTQCNPIIMTSVEDDLDDPNDIPLPPGGAGRALWGGLLLLGRATINDPLGVNSIEGLPAGDPRNEYGGTNDDDNSGVLKYVSVRHGGSKFGDANEINGISLGAVGRGTIIDYVEVYANLDDGIEFFGGVPQVKHAVIGFVGDDDFDYDEGFRGCAQFVMAIKDSLDSDQCGEHDGGGQRSGVDDCVEPYATPLFSNFTYIGAGANEAGGNEDGGFNIRDNAGGGYFNSIVTEMNGPAFTGIEWTPPGEKLCEGSRERLSVGDLYFENNLFWATDGLYDAGEPWVEDSVFGHLTADPNTPDRDNDEANPDIASIDWDAFDHGLDPRPDPLGEAMRGWLDPVANFNPPANPGLTWSGFFEVVDYMGAFDPNGQLWVNNWTALAHYGYLVEEQVDCLACQTDDNKPTVTVTSASIDGFTVWDRNNVYEMDGFVYVDDTDTLLIEPGTIIKSPPGQAGAATAMIVQRDGLLYALGSENCPIIMTSIDDDIDDLNDIVLPPGGAGRALWGGLVMLGNATINDPLGENSIEGLPVEPRNEYGGSDDNDNSGVLKYVSVRHGGSKFGDANEINGITLGGIGRGTIIDHIEVFANLDDGIEFFGGVPQVKHAVIGYVGDDDFDYDEGFRGCAQFVLAIKDSVDSDQCGEHDGGGQRSGVDDCVAPYATPCFSNFTYIGAGSNEAGGNEDGGFNIRDNAGGGYFNSVVTEMNGPAFTGVEWTAPGEKLCEGSRERLSVQDLYFRNNLFWATDGLYDPAETWVEDSIFNDPGCDCGDQTGQYPNMVGDVNCDGGTNPTDVAFLVQFAYKQQDARCDKPLCPYETGDVNCDGGVNPTDVAFLVQFAYKQQDALCDPCRQNLELDPGLGCMAWYPLLPGETLDPVPDVGGNADGFWIHPYGIYDPPANPTLDDDSDWQRFFQTVTYIGAFEPGVAVEDSWIANWSFLYRSTMGTCR